MGWTSLAPVREVGRGTPQRPTPDRRPRRTNGGALGLRSAPMRARRAKAAYGCGSAPVSDRLPQNAGVKSSNVPTLQAEQSSRLDCSACFGQDGGELVDHPAKVFRLDRDRRSETHRGPMGVLGEDPLGKEAFAHLTAGHQLRVDVDPGPQATRPNGDDAVTDEGLKAQAQ